MAIVNYTNAVIDGSNPAYPDRVLIGIKLGVANGAGGGAGASVTVPVSFPSGELPASGLYSVSVDAGQDCIATALNKTAFGFNVKLTPYPAANTLSAGTFNVIVEG